MPDVNYQLIHDTLGATMTVREHELHSFLSQFIPSGAVVATAPVYAADGITVVTAGVPASAGTATAMSPAQIIQAGEYLNNFSNSTEQYAGSMKWMHDMLKSLIQKTT